MISKSRSRKERRSSGSAPRSSADATTPETRRWRIRIYAGGLEAALHVQPRARRSEIAGMHGDALKLRISAPPVDDAANRAVVDFFASLLDLPKSRIRIIAGAKSRDKTIRIEGIEREDFLKRVG